MPRAWLIVRGRGLPFHWKVAGIWLGGRISPTCGTGRSNVRTPGHGPLECSGGRLGGIPAMCPARPHPREPTRPTCQGMQHDRTGTVRSVVDRPARHSCTAKVGFRTRCFGQPLCPGLPAGPGPPGGMGGAANSAGTDGGQATQSCEKCPPDGPKDWPARTACLRFGPRAPRSPRGPTLGNLAATALLADWPHVATPRLPRAGGPREAPTLSLSTPPHMHGAAVLPGCIRARHAPGGCCHLSEFAHLPTPASGGRDGRRVALPRVDGTHRAGPQPSAGRWQARVRPNACCGDCPLCCTLPCHCPTTQGPGPLRCLP